MTRRAGDAANGLLEAGSNDLDRVIPLGSVSP